MKRRAKRTHSKEISSRSSGLATLSVRRALSDQKISFQTLRIRIANLSAKRSADRLGAETIEAQLDRVGVALNFLSAFLPWEDDNVPTTVREILLERLDDLLDAIELLCLGGILLGHDFRGDLDEPANRKKGQQLQAMAARAAKENKDAKNKAIVRDIIEKRLGSAATGRTHKDAASIASLVNEDLKLLGMRPISERTIARRIEESRILKERRQS
jgi:hypothetical protein